MRKNSFLTQILTIQLDGDIWQSGKMSDHHTDDRIYLVEIYHNVNSFLSESCACSNFN